MALLVPVCDTDISGGLTYTNNGQVRCNGPGNTLAWIEVDPETLGDGIMQPLDTSAGVAISVAIISVWAFAWGLSMIIAAVMKTRYS